MKRRDWLRGGALGLVAPAALRAATPGVDAPPDPGPPRPLRLPPMHTEALANGVQLLVATRAHLPLVTAALYQHAGREADPARQSGLASLTAALLPKGSLRGNRPHSATQLAQEAEALGGALDVGAGWRVASLTMTVTTPRLEAALALMAEVARAPLLEATELERQRTQMLDALRVTLASPGEVAAAAARRAYWGDSACGASATPASLARITREDVQRFHRERFGPTEAVLVLAGDITPQAASALATRHFGLWPGTAAPLPPPAPARSLDAATVLIDMPGSGQSSVVVVAPFAAIDASDRVIAEVATAVVGGDYSARLNQEIRIRRGLSYGAFGSGESQRSGGMFSAQAQTDHPNAALVAQLMREQLLALGREAAPLDELRARQATLVGGFARRLGTTAGVAAQLAGIWFLGRPLDALARYVDEVMAVTPEQVRAFAERHWSAASMRTVVCMDASAAAAAAAALGTDARRITLAELDLERATLQR